MAGVIFQLIIALAMVGMVVGFVPTGVRSSSRFASKLMMKEEKTLSLEDKLASKAAARMNEANKKTTATSAVEKKVEKKEVKPSLELLTALQNLLDKST